MADPVQDSRSGSGRALRLTAEVVPAMLVLGALLYAVRDVLSPIVLLGVLLFVLWPERRHPFVSRLLVATCALTLLWILSVTGGLLAPFVLGLAFAYLLAPAVAWLVRRRVPRPLAIAVTLLPFLAGIVLLVLILVPALQRQVVDLAGRLPALLQQFSSWLLDVRTRFLSSGPAFLTDDQAAWLRNLQAGDLVAMVQARWSSVTESAWAAIVGVGRGMGTVLVFALYVVVTPVVTFYLLAAWDRFTGGIAQLVPPSRRDEVYGFLREYDQVLGRYIRGSLTEAALMAVVVGGGLALLGFPGALLVGVAAGIGNPVPYIGFAVAVLPGILLALVSGAVVPSLLKLALIFAIEQLLDGTITGPRIVGGAVGLNPVWVMMSLAVFGALLGFVGLLLAVPLAILVRMTAERIIAPYRQSSYYTGADAPPAAPE